MHAETFLKEFAPLASGPGGIQKLRELVLQLAVRGKLVPQSISDGHASDLAAKALEQVPPRIKKHLAEADQPYSIPANWIWVALGAISNYGETEKVEPGTLEDPDFWILELEDIEKSTSRLLTRVPFRERNFRSSKNRFKEGQVLYGKLRPYLDKVIVADRDGCCTTEIVPFSVFGGIDPHFIRWCMKTPDFISYADNSTYGMNLPRMGTKSAIAAPIPLPPLAEQKRIVAKVNELMALCDALESQHVEEAKLKRAAVASALHQLTEARTPEETADHWSLIAPRFSDLFDDLETIAKFSSAILKLGADGRLDRIAGVSKRHHSEVPISRCVKVLGGGTPSKQLTNYWNGNIPWITPKDMKVAELRDSMDHVSTDAITETNVKLVPANSVLTVVRGMILAKTFPVAISRVPATINQDMKALICDDAVLPEYLALTLNGSRRKVLEQVERSTHGTCRLDTKKLLSVPIRLLEPDEQIAVVAKVDELIALCERLAMGVRESERLNVELMASLVHSLTETDPDGGGPALGSVRVVETTLSFAAPDVANDEAGEQSGSTSVRTARAREAERREVPTGAVEVDTRFKEAVLVGAIVKAFFEAGGEPIGNFRLQKAVYFARRHNGEHVDQMDYLKKAAGPYNPSMKYSGGIAIAKQKEWLHEARGRFGFGHVPGATASEMDEWIARYGYDESARWVAEHFRFKKNEEWETLATIDYAMEHLQSVGIEPDGAEILQYIYSDDEWRPKIEKLGLTENSVEAAKVEVRALFGGEGKEGAR